MDEEQETFDEKEEELNNEIYEKNSENLDVGSAEQFDCDYDVFEFKDYKYAPDDEEEWRTEEENHAGMDWEKEAKKTVRIELDEPVQRRRTIGELDSYASSGPSMMDIARLSVDSIDIADEPEQQIRYSVSMGVRGIARINLSPLTQKIIGCVVGENVTTEYPWVYVRKEIIEDNIDLHDESSDFLYMKNEIHTFPDTKMLIGYAPSLTEEAQFYICLSEEGRDEVVKYIQTKREEHENRVRNAVYKPLGEWEELGSASEIDDTFVKSTRSFFEIEVVSTADLLNVPINLVDRGADDQRDGYIELLPYRQSFENVPNKLINRTTQVTPSTRENEAQTTLSIPDNAWVQYQYEYQPPDISTYNEEQIESLKSFLNRYTNEICEQAELNATWDIYANDYGNLVANEKDTQPLVLTGYKEHQSFHDGKLIVDKVINDLSWHPLWTGIAYAAYTQYSKSNHLVGPNLDNEVLKASEDHNYVLVWSFTDSLTPKLILECPREVTAVAVCPLDGNVIVGGCANGQIMLKDRNLQSSVVLYISIWHIPGKIEQVEAVVMDTTAQVKYRIAMKSLTMWMREAIGSTVVRPAVMSSLPHSVKAGITQIVWVSPHHKVDQNGRIRTLPGDVPSDDLTWQFVTASEDGTVAFWDLKWRPSEKESRPAPSKLQQIMRPEALTQSISPYKVLDRIFRPDYMLVVQYPSESRRQVITTLSMHAPKFRKERVDAFPVSNDNTVRKYYRSKIEKPDFVMKPRILLGTVEGDVGSVTWEGYQFNTDVTVNRELSQWSWFKKVHDGPVTHSVRSKYYDNVVATVGGKIFAIWRDDFGEPLCSKKTNDGYSACAWGTFRPTILVLARMDGSVEIWDFIVNSQEPCFTQSLSGRIITGIYTHELPLDPQCVGFCDFNGILRMFQAPGNLVTFSATDIAWMKKFIDRQVDRISEYKAWQETWNQMNYEHVGKKKKRIEEQAEKKQLEEEKMKAETAEVEARLAAVKKSTTVEDRREFIDKARERWRSMELKRMQQVILEKKGLKRDDLERQRAPILKMRQHAKRKQEKIHEILQLQDKIFEEIVAFFFPEQYQESERISLSRTTEFPTEKGTADGNTSTDDFLQREVEDYFVDPDEEIIYTFMEVQTQALADIQSRPFEYSFDWRKVLAEGKSRRMSMDAELRKCNKPKK